jgi:hypothetical protein
VLAPRLTLKEEKINKIQLKAIIKKIREDIWGNTAGRSSDKDLKYNTI